MMKVLVGAVLLDMINMCSVYNYIKIHMLQEEWCYYFSCSEPKRLDLIIVSKTNKPFSYNVQSGTHWRTSTTTTFKR